MANKLGYKELEQKVKKLEREAFESKRLKEALQQRTHDIGERVKELNCLYGISFLCDKENISLDEILKGTVDLLPSSWQYPDITCSRIILENEEYISENFRETDWKQASDIIMHGKPIGSVEVCYLEEKPESDEGPFLKEERSLINAVAERLGHITERKRAEEALWESEERYRDLYENAPNAYFSISAIDGSILGCNSAALRLLGYDRETLMRMKVFDLYADTPDGKSKAKEVFKRFKAGESIRDVELQMKRKQGEPTWISLSVAPLRDRDGKITESRSMVIDISERKRAEEALERRNRELSSLNIIATTISRSIELEKVLADTLRTVLDLMGLKAGWIFLREGESDRLILTSHLGLSPEFVKEEMELPLGNCICSHVMRRTEPLIAENILKCPRLSRSVVERERLARHASAPLISKDKVVGVMNVASEDLRPFSPEDLNLLTAIGRQVGVAIENARLFEDTRQKSAELQEAYERLKSLYEDLKAEREKTKSLRKALEDKFGLGNIVGKNDKMKAIYDLIEGVSQSDSTVLIQGESGTGKELIARAIQLLSPRKERPFVVANCSAYAQTLLESELFGHEKGAFTGAIKRKKGRFELADGGTIFLDEIGEIPPATQLLLLRVLQEKRFERVGGEDTVKVDVRVIAATNRNLAREMMEGRFREDLYYRLNVIPIIVPPLRERKDDIALLAKHFLEIYSAANSKPIRGFSEEVMQIFLDHNWPGNVRELQNVVEHAVILAKGEMIEEIDLPQDLKGTFPRAEADISSLKDTERNLILKVLRETEGNKYQAAKRLGITRSTLYGKLRKHGIVARGKDS
jgi:PAS domain S-box-containing protein